MKIISLDPYLHGTLMRDLVGHDHKPAAFLVYLWLYAEQDCLGQPVAISHAKLAEETGLSRSTIQSAIACLLRRNLLVVSKESVTATPIYSTVKPWRRQSPGSAPQPHTPKANLP